MVYNDYFGCLFNGRYQEWNGIMYRFNQSYALWVETREREIEKSLKFICGDFTLTSLSWISWLGIKYIIGKKRTEPWFYMMRMVMVVIEGFAGSAWMAQSIIYGHSTLNASS